MGHYWICFSRTYILQVETNSSIAKLLYNDKLWHVLSSFRKWIRKDGYIQGSYRDQRLEGNRRGGNVSVNSKTTHAPPRANPRAFDFFEKVWSNSPLCCQLDGQMPHPLELQRGSNTPPSRHVKQTVETSSTKFSAATNFLFSLSSLHTLNKGIFHDRTI